MKLVKRIAVAALAAAMAVSMLTACGGGGGGGGSTGNSGSSNIGGGTTAPGTGSGTPGADNPGTGGSTSTEKPVARETVAYLQSRTYNFFSKIERTGYTADVKIIEKIDENRKILEAHISGKGERSYLRMALADILGKETVGDQSMITLTDEKQKAQWLVFPVSKDGMEEVTTLTGDSGKAGVYSSVKMDKELSGKNIIDGCKPTPHMEFKKEKKGTTYIESQTVNGLKYLYCYTNNGEDLKYIDVRKEDSDKLIAKVGFKNLSCTPDKSLMDFDSILKNYLDVTSTKTDAEKQSYMQVIIKGMKSCWTTRRA